MENKDKLLGVFFDDPTGKFHVRELARVTKLNPNTILNLVGTFIKEGILKREKKKHIVEISVDYGEKFKRLKKLDNLRRLCDSGIIDELRNKFDPEVIVVFGSYSFGEDISGSDIDLAVISNKEKEIDLKKYERNLNRGIHLLVVHYNKISNEFYTNLINGIVLDGALRKK